MGITRDKTAGFVPCLLMSLKNKSRSSSSLVDSTTLPTAVRTALSLETDLGLLMAPSNFHFKPLTEVKSMFLMGRY